MNSFVKKGLLFGAGFVTCALLAVAIPLLVMAMGLMDMSASAKPGLLERTIAPWAFDNSMAKRASDAKNPLANDPSAMAPGMALYRENCVPCHGAPHVNAAKLAAGLNPPAPYLEIEDTQSLSDGELFWIIKNGIRMTGMPAFGPTRNDNEIWHIVSFVRHLPRLTDAETKTLRSAVSDTEHHQEEISPNAGTGK